MLVESPDLWGWPTHSASWDDFATWCNDSEIDRLGCLEVRGGSSTGYTYWDQVRRAWIHSCKKWEMELLYLLADGQLALGGRWLRRPIPKRRNVVAVHIHEPPGCGMPMTRGVLILSVWATACSSSGVGPADASVIDAPSDAPSEMCPTPDAIAECQAHLFGSCNSGCQSILGQRVDVDAGCWIRGQFDFMGCEPFVICSTGRDVCYQNSDDGHVVVTGHPVPADQNWSECSPDISNRALGQSYCDVPDGGGN
jgi:hypothetical protein